MPIFGRRRNPNGLAISPSCGDFITGDPLPAYTTAATCQEPNGEWYLQVDEYCSDPTYSTEVNCIEPNGTWTPGTCSNALLFNQGDCDNEGSCSNATYDNNEVDCLGEGTCSDPTWDNNLGLSSGFPNYGYPLSPNGCLSQGTCSDPAFDNYVENCLTQGECYGPLKLDADLVANIPAIYLGPAAGNNTSSLTVGMTVDANVIIFERIKEELLLGTKVNQALETAYRKAFLTILDANITTLITAFVLSFIGSGPIKGFATTLSVGIICSMFTAVFVTKTIFLFGFNNKNKISI